MKIVARQIKALVKLSFLELWRRNDMFALLILAVALMAPLSMGNPFGAAGASRYLDEVALLLIWGFSLFIAIGTGARLFPPEFESRTIYPLLAKPISRPRLLVGKYLGALAASVSALALFYSLFALSIVFRGGALGLEHAQGFALHILFVALAVAFSLLFSLLLSPAAGNTLSAVALVSMFFFGQRLLAYAETLSAPLAVLVKIVYAAGPHVEFFDMRQRMIHGWGAVDGGVFAAASVYALCYTAALLFLAALALRRKRI